MLQVHTLKEREKKKNKEQMKNGKKGHRYANMIRVVHATQSPQSFSLLFLSNETVHEATERLLRDRRTLSKRTKCLMNDGV